MIEELVAALAGLLIGSFLNVCIYRLPRDLSVVRPRSFCPACENMIAWYDNIPVVSFILLRSRCRHCRAPISIRYPLVELSTAAAFALCVFEYGPSLQAVELSLFSAILIALIFSDIEERILPDEFTIGGTILGMVFALLVPLPPGLVYLLLPYSVGPRWLSLGEAALGAGVSSGCIWLVGWLYSKFRHREGLGFGDVKMIAMIGAFLGLQWALLILIAASLVGSIGGLLYIFVAKKEAATYELPFGSFLGIAALAAALFRVPFMTWYSHLGR